MNSADHLIAALNACVMVGYVAQCAVRGITLESLSIETDGKIDLRGFLGIDPAVPPGYEALNYTVRIKGSGTREQFAEVHTLLVRDLQRDFLVDPRVVGEIDRAEAAASDRLEDLVLPDDLPAEEHPRAV